MIAASKGIMECDDLDKLFMLAKKIMKKNISTSLYKDAKN